ncbi:hypothetical protein K2173_027644 [Erythroxylum novogranatense]|uniref:PGG domain-containing protein n=1 Tax=Erythroxylum novogranatense TaxID=1862640 RepID=A0AAV8TZL5_9ROSI|nr:hypothetical protein K2173_027644 [Erythroxylum novogranatense]
MDMKLLDVSLSGYVDHLHQLVRENPIILNNICLLSAENPLHIASITGHLDFVKEILRLKPEFAKELNHDGLTPMHIAVVNRYVDIVGELASADCELCRLKGKDMNTPLHLAAIKGRVDIISVLLLACPQNIEDVNAQRETALHLGVKNNQFQAVEVLLDWIREIKREDVLNIKDELGNTVLHIAAWKKQRQVIELLLGFRTTMNPNSLQVNATNNSGLTALDVLLIFPSEAGDREITDILCSAGALKASQLSPESEVLSVGIPSTPEMRSVEQAQNLVEYFKFKKGRDSPSETRTALLVIAVLVATATFQVGVNPPGGLWQDTLTPDQINGTGTNSVKPHKAGESIMATSNAVAFALIVFFNSVGLSVSLVMINILTSRFPLQVELQICMFTMYSTYNTALTNMAGDNTKLYATIATSIITSLIPLTFRWARLNSKRIKDMVHRVTSISTR